MEHCWIPEKENLQICWGGNGTCPDSRKSEFPNLCGWKLGISDPKKMNFQICLGGNVTRQDSRKSEFPNLI